MYLNLLTRALGRGGAAVWKSPVAWIAVVLLALVGVGVAIHQRRGTATDAQTAEAQGVTVASNSVASNTGASNDTETPQPGGLAPMVLERSQHPEAFLPEFLSVTLLPGRGMNVLQITAFLPGKGVVPLLAAPGLADAAKAMTGTGDDAGGQASLTQGAAIEVPWAGRVTGAAMPGGVSIAANWRGRSLTLPANWAAGPAQGADGGLLLRSRASEAEPSVMPDGGVADASFDAGNFNGHWASQTTVKTTAVLSARTVDLTVTARNTGTEPEPMGIGWRPRFALPGGDRAQVRLRLPSSARVELKDAQSGLPGGHVVPVEGTAFDFSKLDGVALGSVSLDDLYVLLKSGPLSSGPEVELRDPAANYGLRLTALTPSIKAMRVVAPAGAAYVSIDPQTNYDDPFGHAWGKDQDTGMVVLQPNQSMEWKVRLEIFALSNAGATVPHLTSPGQ